jgi:hypothetical protein
MLVVSAVTVAWGAIFVATVYYSRGYFTTTAAPSGVVFTTPTILKTLCYTSISAAVAAALTGIIGLAAVRARGAATTVFTLCSVIGALVLLPFLLETYDLSSYYAFHLTDEVHLPDGQSYCLVSQHYLIGDRLSIGRPESNFLVVRSMVPIGSASTDSPRRWVSSPCRWASVIRRAGASDNVYGELHLGESGILAGFARGCRCFLAYDTHSDHFIGSEEILGLSPFILIGTNDTMHQSDIDDLISREREGPRSDIDSGLPTDEGLNEALSHPNAAVRDLARQILDIRERRQQQTSGSADVNH